MFSSNLRALALALGLIATPACAQVTLDSNGGVSANVNSSPVTNTNLTIGTGSNRCLVVQFSYYEGGSPGTVSATWNGVSMSTIASGNDTSGKVFNVLFGLVAPASGNHTIQVSWSNSGATLFWAINGISFTNCKQTSTFINANTATGTGTAISNSITNPSGNIAIDIANSVNGPVTAPTQTQTYNDAIETFSGGSYSSSVNPTFSWTTSSGPWVDTGISIVAAPAASNGGWFPLGLLSTCPGQAASYLAAVTQPPPPLFTSAVCSFATGLAYTGISNLDGLYFLAAPDAASSKVNYVSPGTFNLTAVTDNNAPAFLGAYLGWNSGGNAGGTTGGHLATGFDYTSGTHNYTLNNASIFAYRMNFGNPSELIGNANCDTDLYDNTSFPNVFPRVNSNNASTYSNSVPTVPALILAQRSNSALVQSVWFGGQLNNSISDTSVNDPSDPLTFLKACGNNFSPEGVGLAGFGGPLSDTQNITLANISARYINAVQGTTPTNYPTYAFPIIGSAASGVPDSLPSMARLPNGQLMAVWSNQALTVGTGNIQQSFSSNNGQSWSAPSTLVAAVGGRAIYEPWVSVVGANIYVTWWNLTTGGGSGQTYIMTGTMTGNTINWGSPVNLVTSGSPLSYPYGPVVQLSNGNLIQAFYTNTMTGYCGILTNSGAGFTTETDIITSGAPDANDQWSEITVSPTQGSNIVAVIRNDNTVTTSRTGYWSMTSSNNGATWGGLTQIFTETQANHPGGFTTASTPTGAVFLLGRFTTAASGQSPWGTAWSYLPFGGSWETPQPLAFGQQIPFFDAYNGCFYDSVSISVMCAVAFGNDAEPGRGTANYIQQLQFVAQ